MPKRPEKTHTRPQRAQSVLATLRRLRLATKSQLADACGLSRPTIAALLRELSDLGLVEERDAATGGGRPAKQYGLASKPGLVVGLDLTQGSLAFAAATLDGTVVATAVRPITSVAQELRFAQLVTVIGELVAPVQRKFGRMRACVLANTGVIDEHGTIVRSDLVPEWAGFPLAQRLTAQLRCPVRVENNINAAAYGEYAQRAATGALRPSDDALYMNFTHGFHTGLILAGELHRGHTWNAGEITDVLGDLSFDAEAGPVRWAAQAVQIIGPLTIVVDPRLVIISAPEGSSDDAVHATSSRINSLRPASMPPIAFEPSLFGRASAVVGALMMAFRDAEEALLDARPQTPVALQGLGSIAQELRKGRHVMISSRLTPQSTKALRIGVVGVGARASLALKAEDSQIPAAIVAACEPHTLAAERIRNQLRKDPSTITVVSTVPELIAAGIDAAFVTSPDDTHADISCALLEAGIAVYLEKPLAIHLDDATRILQTAHRTGTKLYVGHNMRHMNVVRTMRDLIRAGRIGEVKAIWCRHFVGSGGDFYFKDWHATREHGTGLLLQKAAHDIDVMHWLADSHTTQVVGMGDLMVYDQVSSRADHSNELMSDWYSLDNWPPLAQRGLNEVIDVEDLSMVLMRMRSGVLASYQQCHFTPDYWRNYTIIGTEGRIENFGDGEGGVIKLWNRRTHYNPDGDEQFPILGDANGHGDADKLIVEEFLRFVADDALTDTNPIGAWYSVAAGIEATNSLRDGSTPRAVPELSPELINYFNKNQRH